MICIDNKKKCCGCTACFEICPKQCIELVEDIEGFIYPKVDISICINCHLCESVCPTINMLKPNSFEVINYIARTKNFNVLSKSTSGGIFTPLMEWALDNGGIIYGVIRDGSNCVKHVRISRKDDINISKIPGSKYVRSDIKGILCSVKNDLEANKIVLFSGTPCQVAGLKKFLQKDYEKLYLVDVICRGNPSPLFWGKYINHLEKKYKSKANEISWRSKQYGYHHSSIHIEFNNNKCHNGSIRSDYFLKAFFNDLISRPSCYECQFKGLKHFSDLTLFDAWNAQKVNNSIVDDDKGFTHIFIQSKKGARLIELIKAELIIYKGDVNKSVELDGIMVLNSVFWNKKREGIFIDLDKYSFKVTCNKYINISLKNVIIDRLKEYVWKKNEK